MWVEGQTILCKRFKKWTCASPNHRIRARAVPTQVMVLDDDAGRKMKGDKGP